MEKNTYVQMLPSYTPTISEPLPLYNKFSDQNPSPTFGHNQIGEAHKLIPNLYDVPNNQGFGIHSAINPSYDRPPPRSKSRAASPFITSGEKQPSRRESTNPDQLPVPGDCENMFADQYPHRVKDMDSKQIQLLVSQFESMGAVDCSTEEIADQDDVYETLSDEEDTLYDDINAPNPLYMNVDNLPNSASAQDIHHPQQKARPIPHPRICKKQVTEEHEVSSTGESNNCYITK